ncbi:hypothetical protein PR202_gb16765 [Eleusine coracana subsp. coracana]|uniref:Uncharacterized protein n=1 Tax=Eleusine coracana subsp. coracana TaxID=191504 RepID=A0AAV5F183_ELECO|nr:hypothetical protein PR202_gb16708 [Eleusine coracana subsp. coracana]GJN28617.1 hypothetical protein PR202_gb16765 [Eleusine coracana subsp. coracana]
METPLHLHGDATGFLRHGKDAFLVAKLNMAPSELRKPAAELLMLRSSTNKWTVKRAAINVVSDKCRELTLWRTDMVVPVSNRILCWVDLSHGVMIFRGGANNLLKGVLTSCCADY